MTQRDRIDRSSAIGDREFFERTRILAQLNGPQQDVVKILRAPLEPPTFRPLLRYGLAEHVGNLTWTIEFRVQDS